MMQNRMPLLEKKLWSKQQQDCVNEIIQGPRSALLSPFEPLLHSPELLTHTQRMGGYLRYNRAIGCRLSELTILIVARYWNQSVEWAIHAPIAIKNGIAIDIVTSINLQQMPTGLTDDENCIYQFCCQILTQKQVVDELWQESITRFGEKGVIDLIGLIGYYTFLSFVMNGCQTPVPTDLSNTLINHV